MSPTEKKYKKISLYWKCQLIGWALFAVIPIIYLFSFGKGVHIVYDKSVLQPPPNVFNDDKFYFFGGIKIFVTGIFVSHLMKLVIKRFKILERTFQRQVIYLLGLTIIFSILFFFIINIAVSGDYESLYAANFYRRTGLFQLILFTGAFMIWNLIYFVYNYMKKVRMEEQNKTKMKVQILELEAKALRAQMNPHFIFNCLNSIKSLIQQHEEERSVTYLTTFSKLIRTLFNNADKKEISLFDEMETCKLYLQLEAMRFDTNFSYNFSIDETIDLKSISVPALIIQPFIENAIWHGIVPKGSGGNVLLSVNKNNNNIEIIVDDNGIGRESSQQNKTAASFGHQSKGVNLTQSRLELDNLLQQRQAKLETIDKKDEQGKASGTRVIITLPQEE